MAQPESCYTLNNGNKIPKIALGTWKATDDEIKTTIREAIKIGYRSIDTAPVYMNEAAIGQALHDIFEEGLVKREEVTITTKLWMDAHRAEDVRKSTLKSIQDLQVEYVDLLLIHWPFSAIMDFENDKLTYEFVPLSETWAAMEKLVEEGDVKNIGLSNFNVQLILDLLSYCKIKPVVNQVELHPYHPRTELLEWCKSQGIFLEAYCPLGLGFVPGAKQPDVQKILDNPTVKEVASRIGKSPAQVILAWGVNRGERILPKSSNIARLQENFDAAEIELSGEDMKKLDSIETRAVFYPGFDSMGLPIFA